MEGPWRNISRWNRPQRRATWLKRVLFAVLVSHIAILAVSGSTNSPTMDEAAHLPAGISHWHYGTFALYRVNPPLPRMIAALPVLFMQPKLDWRDYNSAPGSRHEFAVARAFMRANGSRSSELFVVARWACIPFSVAGAVLCYLWGTALYGARAGLLAAVLWCVCPNILGHAALVTPDVAAAAFGVGASYSFWRWHHSPSVSRALVCGVALGLALLTKFTWLVLPLLWPAMCVAALLCQRSTKTGWARRMSHQVVIVILGALIVNIGYGFRGSLQRLGDYNFVSRSLRGSTLADGTPYGNRFRGQLLGGLPIPLPSDYVLGIDTQKKDFEAGMPSYLRGEWRNGGWWYYYMYACVIKTPIGTLLIVVLACMLRNQRTFPRRVRDLENVVLVLGPGMAVFVLVSAQTGFNHHLRYVLPTIPFAFVWASRIARLWPQCGLSVRCLAASALGATIAACAYTYPHYLSYFNEFAGGARGGHWHLHNSNVDWGQDLLRVKRWYDEHPEARPLHLKYDQEIVIPPKVFGIEYEPVPVGPIMNRRGHIKTSNWPWGDVGDPMPSHDVKLKDEPFGPIPGWYALSSNSIHDASGCYEYFLDFEPVAMAGDSVYIYHITPDEANHLRRRLGLPELKQWPFVRDGSPK